MNDEQPIWERWPGEPLRWFTRFEHFRLMTPTRSIAAVFRQEETAKNREKPRTFPGGDWYAMADLWQWEKRAGAWDLFQVHHLEQAIEAEKTRVLLTGYAVMYRRIAVLNAKAEQLLEETEQENRVWLKDAKMVGEERIDLVRFNAPLFAELRACLADIAAELGERVKKKEIALKDLPANLYLGGFDPDQDGVDDREVSEEDGAQEDEVGDES